MIHFDNWHFFYMIDECRNAANQNGWRVKDPMNGAYVAVRHIVLMVLNSTLLDRIGEVVLTGVNYQVAH